MAVNGLSSIGSAEHAFPPSLVGLLSFMCADEMTTGSVMATAADRATLAARSHAFNITQPRFKKIFPEYSKERQIDLPNMGERRKDAAGSTSAQAPPVTSETAIAKQEQTAETKASTAGKVWKQDV